MTDTTSSNSPKSRDNHGIQQQQGVYALYPDSVPEYVGTLPEFVTEHASMGIQTGDMAYDEVLTNSSADYMGAWNLADAYHSYPGDESERQRQRGG